MKYVSSANLYFFGKSAPFFLWIQNDAISSFQVPYPAFSVAAKIGKAEQNRYSYFNTVLF